MPSNIHRSDQPISRVKCVVDKCEFWGNGNHCYASVIEVQDDDAGTVEATDCGTFRNKME